MSGAKTIFRSLIGLYAALTMAACDLGVGGDDGTESAEQALTVSRAWVRLNPIPSRPAAAYFTVVNYGAQPDRLVGIGVPAGGRAHLHRSQRSPQGNGEIMQMLFIDSVTILPGATLEFSPGGFHAMLFDLAGPPEVGGLLRIALQFEKAGTVIVDAEIRAIGASD